MIYFFTTTNFNFVTNISRCRSRTVFCQIQYNNSINVGRCDDSFHYILRNIVYLTETGCKHGALGGSLEISLLFKYIVNEKFCRERSDGNLHKYLRHTNKSTDVSVSPRVPVENFKPLLTNHYSSPSPPVSL